MLSLWQSVVVLVLVVMQAGWVRLWDWDAPESCLDENRRECNHQGRCEDGVCRCLSDKYSGPLCNECWSCHDWCEKFRACVQCTTYRTGPLGTQECSRCYDKGRFTIVPTVADNIKGQYKCRHQDESDQCWFTFAILETDIKQPDVLVARSKEC